MRLHITVLFASALVLSGCQLTGGSESPDLANTDFSNMSCSEIKAVFDNYKSAMDTADGATGLLSAVGVSAGTNQAKSVMIQTYNQAKKAATPVMKVKQCSERI
ncbi:hypothetical protein [Vibrio harveyi]|uniref:hypothetical protein n=1 Tax=Vibrio harveyi TaxID=669 RepID=UPI003BB77898